MGINLQVINQLWLLVFLRISGRMHDCRYTEKCFVDLQLLFDYTENELFPVYHHVRVYADIADENVATGRY